MSTSEELAAIIQDFRRRIADLERSNGLQKASVMDANGNAVSVVPAIIAASGMLSQALDAAVSGAEEDGLVNIYLQELPPVASGYGDFWKRESDGQLFMWDGSAWVDYTNKALADAITTAAASGGTGDTTGLIRSFWQSDAPSSADEGDLWYETDAGNRPHRWTSGVWQMLQLGTEALVQAGVDPDRLTVAVSGNMVQDPVLKTGIRTTTGTWSIVGPDTVYPESNYLRSANRSAVDIDQSFWITDKIAVDPGRTFRIATKFRFDAASMTSSTGFDPRVRVRVYFYKSQTDVAPFSTAAQLEETLFNETDAVVGVWNDLDGAWIVPEGYAFAQAKLANKYQTAGFIDYIKPEVQVLWDRVQSADFNSGESGWGFNNQLSQVPSLQVLSDLGAVNMSSDTFNLAGTELTEFFLDLPRGLVAQGARSNADDAGNVSTTEMILWQFNVGELHDERIYRVSFRCFFQTSAPGAYDFVFKYADGSNPTLSSTNVPGSVQRQEFSSSDGHNINISCLWSPPSTITSEDVRLILTARRVTGSGYGWCHQGAGDSNRRMEWDVEDLGLDVSNSLAISQKKTGGGLVPPSIPATPDPDPVQNFTKSWYSTWDGSYDGDNTARGADAGRLYQGYISSTHGNTRSLFGFDYAAIQAALANATVLSVKLTYKPQHVWGYAGITVLISSHNYTSEPSTWNTANVVENRISKTGQKEGVTYTHTLPIAVGNEFKSGSTRGLGFGPGSSNSASSYYGWMYGGSSGSRPKLTISYRK